MFQRLIVALAALAAALGTARLGLWQLDRAAQKTALQAAIESRAAMPPIDGRQLPSEPARLDGLQHRRATVEGVWLPAHTVYLDNRQMNGRVGFFVLTPLRMDDGRAIVVERGWQPRDFTDRQRIVPPPAADERVTVTGRLARGPARLYEFDGAASGPIRQNLDLASFSAELGLPLLPATLVQTAAAPGRDDGLSRDWPRPDTGVAKHHGYAFQWFALSALVIALYVWFQVLRPRRARR